MDSLSILLPSSIRVGRPSSLPILLTPPNELAKEIEQLTLRPFALINERNWSSPDWQLLSLDFNNLATACASGPPQPHSFTSAKSRAAFIEKLRRITVSNPAYYLKVTSCEVDVNEAAGEATAWVCMWMLGNPAGWKMENVAIVRWRRESGGLWRAWSQTILKGVVVAPV
jgi:hypothetical protein